MYISFVVNNIGYHCKIWLQKSYIISENECCEISNATLALIDPIDPTNFSVICWTLLDDFLNLLDIIFASIPIEHCPTKFTWAAHKFVGASLRNKTMSSTFQHCWITFKIFWISQFFRYIKTKLLHKFQRIGANTINTFRAQQNLKVARRIESSM